MRYSTFAMPLAAALLLAACSTEQAPENEAGGNEMMGDESLVSDASDDELADVPPPPPLPDAEDSGNTSDDEADNGSDDEVATAIPARFHGEWNQDLSACGTGSSETRLRISGDRLRFYESAGEVSEVDIVNDRVIEVTAAYSGEGQTWTNERRLSLSPDGDTLTVTGEGATMTRSRCP